MTVSCPGCIAEYAGGSDGIGQLWQHLLAEHPATARRIREAAGGRQTDVKRVNMSVDDRLAVELRRIVDKIAALDRKRDDLIQRRNHTIITAHQQGASLRDIADLAGISHVQVRNIIRQEE